MTYDNWLTKPLEDADDAWEQYMRSCMNGLHGCYVVECFCCGAECRIHSDDCEARGHTEDQHIIVDGDFINGEYYCETCGGEQVEESK